MATKEEIEVASVSVPAIRGLPALALIRMKENRSTANSQASYREVIVELVENTPEYKEIGNESD